MFRFKKIVNQSQGRVQRGEGGELINALDLHATSEGIVTSIVEDIEKSKLVFHFWLPLPLRVFIKS
jgi:hypothetical protein